MHHFNGCITCLFGGFDLLSVFVTVTNLKRKCIVCNVAFNMDAKVNLDTIAFLQNHLSVPTLYLIDSMVSCEMSSKVIDSNCTRERRLSTVPMDVTLSRFNDFVEGLSWRQFKASLLRVYGERRAQHPSNISVSILPPSDHVTRRYNAFSDNSYQWLIGFKLDFDERASRACFTISCNHSYIRKAQFRRSFSHCVRWFITCFIRTRCSNRPSSQSQSTS